MREVSAAISSKGDRAELVLVDLVGVVNILALFLFVLIEFNEELLLFAGHADIQDRCNLLHGWALEELVLGMMNGFIVLLSEGEAAQRR